VHARLESISPENGALAGGLKVTLLVMPPQLVVPGMFVNDSFVGTMVVTVVVEVVVDVVEDVVLVVVDVVVLVVVELVLDVVEDVVLVVVDVVLVVVDVVLVVVDVGGAGVQNAFVVVASTAVSARAVQPAEVFGRVPDPS